MEQQPDNNKPEPPQQESHKEGVKHGLGEVIHEHAHNAREILDRMGLEGESKLKIAHSFGLYVRTITHDFKDLISLVTASTAIPGPAVLPLAVLSAVLTASYLVRWDENAKQFRKQFWSTWWDNDIPFEDYKDVIKPNGYDVNKLVIDDAALIQKKAKLVTDSVIQVQKKVFETAENAYNYTTGKTRDFFDLGVRYNLEPVMGEKWTDKTLSGLFNGVNVTEQTVKDTAGFVGPKVAAAVVPALKTTGREISYLFSGLAYCRDEGRRLIKDSYDYHKELFTGKKQGMSPS